MLALHQTVRMPEDHILRLSVPSVPKGEEVEVLVLAKDVTSHAAKIALMAQAARDPLYQQDMEEDGGYDTFADERINY
ncbi:MAG TPA: hypothetical protein VFX22_02475 [Candidatus Kapabacteria bacterium]|nr:hypothetical protein [Candidatus Kapabacteria bacterium]